MSHHRPSSICWNSFKSNLNIHTLYTEKKKEKKRQRNKERKHRALVDCALCITITILNIQSNTNFTKFHWTILCASGFQTEMNWNTITQHYHHKITTFSVRPFKSRKQIIPDNAIHSETVFLSVPFHFHRKGTEEALPMHKERDGLSQCTIRKQTMNNNIVIRRISIKIVRSFASIPLQFSIQYPSISSLHSNALCVWMSCYANNNEHWIGYSHLSCTLPLHNFILHRNISKVNNKYLLLQELDMNWILFPPIQCWNRAEF